MRVQKSRELRILWKESAEAELESKCEVGEEYGAVGDLTHCNKSCPPELKSDQKQQVQ